MPKHKIFFILALIFLTFFLLSCKPLEKPPEIENITEEENLTIPSEVTGPCPPGWKCISKWTKAYQYENCSWSPARLECPLGCLNNTCVLGKTCPSGFKCLDENRLAYQTEDCLFINIKKCEWRCQNDECLPLPENYTETLNQTNETLVEVPPTPVIEAPKEEIHKLSFGQTEVIEVNGKKYNLSLYNLEPDRVIIALDNFQSGWLFDQGNFTFSVGITIFIREILFQSYAGGTREVSYVIK